ncbi:MAG: UPF0104 family protein [Wenzhouxiangellaceae bacterium]|nr:MAG: UPF0104 family protein [Wenzhouxiangellaceae bacterium]
MRPAVRLALNWAISATVLVALAWWLDWREILRGLGSLSAGWLLLALGLALLQTLVAAWRWHYTGARLGLALPLATATREYFLSSLVNQLLPGGVLGDAWRAQRHAEFSRRTGPAWRAVILERASGQLAVVLITLAVLLSPPWQQALDRLALSWTELAVGLLILAALAVAIVAVLRNSPALRDAIDQTWRDARRALLNRRDLPLQLASSLLIVGLLSAVFASAGQAAGVDAGFWLLWLLAVPVLLAMLIPVSVAGWGLREAAAAGIFLAMGLPAEQGVTVAAAYGLIILAASLPGALVLLSAQTSNSADPYKRP